MPYRGGSGLCCEWRMAGRATRGQSDIHFTQPPAACLSSCSRAGAGNRFPRERTGGAGPIGGGLGPGGGPPMGGCGGATPYGGGGGPPWNCGWSGRSGCG